VSGNGRWTFAVAGLPVAQGSHVAVTSASTGRPFVKVSNAQRLAQWRHDLGEAARRSGVPCTPGPVEVFAVFTFARPKSHLGKRGLRPSAPVEHTQRPDLDKLARALLDALTAIAYTDDRNVVSLTLAKVWSERPGCVVHVVAALEGAA